MCRRYLSCIPIFTFCFVASAQPANISGEQGAPPPAQTDNRITLYVVANDKSGNPITGLQQQDFTILDNKQPQKIISFEAARGTTQTNADVEIVLVLDAVNTTFTRVAFAREQMDKFLKQDGGRLARPVSIAIFTDAGFNMQRGASRDGNALAAYLDQQETGLRSMNRSQGFYGAADRSDLSLRAVQQLATYEEKRPGRKLVIWISPGWPLLTGPRIELTSKQQQSIFATIVDLSTQLRQSGITLYSVDPLGTSDSVGLQTFYYEQFLKAVTLPKQVQYGNLALQVLAVHSGGRVLNSNNDIASEMERCARDANAYYVLRFDAPAADGPSYYNSIEVKIAQPKIKAQTLSGYYAQPGQGR